MCGRYYIDPEDDVEELLAIPVAASSLEAKRYGEIRPADTALVLANNRSMQQRLFPMKWGFPRPDGKFLMINARSETAQQKAMFSESTMKRRCIIPASGYYEWGRKDKLTKTKHQYVFFKPDSRLIYMAGLYMVDEASHVSYYTILTKDAAPHIAQIHGRMPVILPQDAIAKWLSPVGSYPELISFANSDIRASLAEQ